MKRKLPSLQYYERVLTRMNGDSYEETYDDDDIKEVRNRIRQMWSRKSFPEPSVIEDNKNFLDELKKVKTTRTDIPKIIGDLISIVLHDISKLEHDLQLNDV